MKNEVENTEEVSTETIKDEGEEMTDDKVTPAEQKDWKAKILGINNRKLLDFICTLCQARRDIGRADHQVSKTEKKDKNGSLVNIYEESPSKMMPMFPTESENMDEN